MTDTTGKIVAPWSDEQVANLNAYQRAGVFHPFTCRDRGDEAHREQAAASGQYDVGLLVADNDGWRCPACAYRQDWAHGFMADPEALAAQKRMLGSLRVSAQVEHEPGTQT